LNGAINKSLASPEFLDVLKVNGFLPVGGTPGALGSMVAKDMAIWKVVVEKTKLRPVK